MTLPPGLGEREIGTARLGGRRCLPRILEGIGNDHANQPEDSRDAEQRTALALVIDHATEDVSDGAGDTPPSGFSKAKARLEPFCHWRH